MQLRLKEERDAKRAQIDDRHQYVLTLVADSLGIDKAEVDDAILEGNQVNRKYSRRDHRSYVSAVVPHETGRTIYYSVPQMDSACSHRIKGCKCVRNCRKREENIGGRGLV